MPINTQPEKSSLMQSWALLLGGAVFGTGPVPSPGQEHDIQHRQQETTAPERTIHTELWFGDDEGDSDSDNHVFLDDIGTTFISHNTCRSSATPSSQATSAYHTAIDTESEVHSSFSRDISPSFSRNISPSSSCAVPLLLSGTDQRERQARDDDLSSLGEDQDSNYYPTTFNILSTGDNHSGNDDAMSFQSCHSSVISASGSQESSQTGPNQHPNQESPPPPTINQSTAATTTWTTFALSNPNAQRSLAVIANKKKSLVFDNLVSVSLWGCGGWVGRRKSEENHHHLKSSQHWGSWPIRFLQRMQQQEGCDMELLQQDILYIAAGPCDEYYAAFSAGDIWWGTADSHLEGIYNTWDRVACVAFGEPAEDEFFDDDENQQPQVPWIVVHPHGHAAWYRLPIRLERLLSRCGIYNFHPTNKYANRQNSKSTVGVAHVSLGSQDTFFIQFTDGTVDYCLSSAADAACQKLEHEQGRQLQKVWLHPELPFMDHVILTTAPAIQSSPARNGHSHSVHTSTII